MTPGIWLTTFQAAGLPEVLTLCSDSNVDQGLHLRYVYLESPTHVQLLPFAESSMWWQQAHYGRAFGPTLEFRWRRLDNLLIEAQILWEDGHAPPDSAEQRMKWTASEWNALFEPRVRPRSLLLTDRPGSVLRCLDYLCDGMVVITRLCDITPFES